MSSRLEAFFELLETNFPLGGPRRYLFNLLGREVVDALELAKLLAYQRMSDTYPCPHPGGDGCPRQVIEMIDGTYHAVCGNDPRECEDLVLKQKDVEHLSVDPRTLCEGVARALKVKVDFEDLNGLKGVFKVGTFIPDPGVRQPVFLVVRCSKTDYAEVLDALRSRHEREAFAVLVPTDRFIADDTARQMASFGIPLLPLDDVLGIEDGRLASLVDPLSYFKGIGNIGPSETALTPKAVAQAFICDGQGKSTWRDLGEQQYRELVSAADSYLIFADELTKTVIKDNGTGRKSKANVQVAHFRMIKAAASKRTGYFDPDIDGPDEDQVSGKQIFQRARAVFDLKRDKTWALFKSVTVDSHAQYHLNPDPGISFAFIFLPTS
jgi:hypothetical protein